MNKYSSSITHINAIMLPDGPLTSTLIRDFKAVRGSAAEELWQRFFAQVVRVARHRLRGFPRRVEDEEDVALSVFRRLCEMAASDQLNEVRNSDDLWALLVTITGGKVRDTVRRQTADKRGGGAVRGESALGNKADSGGMAGLDAFVGENLAPESLVVVEEEIRRLLDMLPDDATREVGERFLQGQQKTEIADEMSISRSTVYLKLSLILSIWREELADA